MDTNDDKARIEGACADKTLIGDVGKPLSRASEKASASFGMISFALIVGFAVGVVVWAVFWLSSVLTSLLWVDARVAIEDILASCGISSWWLPIAFCSAGGLAIGVWTATFGGAPESLEKVMATVRKTGGYKLERPVASVVGFLLPLVFGGSIGPEAGLTGIIAAACTRIGRALKSAGLRVKGVADLTVSAALSAVFATPIAGIAAVAEEDYGDARCAVREGRSARDVCNGDAGHDRDGLAGCAGRAGLAGRAGHGVRDLDAYEFRRGVKSVLYIASGIGAFAGMMALTAAFGAESGMPRFDGVAPDAVQLWWALPCLLVGYAGAVLYHLGNTCFACLSDRLGERPVAKPLLAGHVMGILAIPLPYVLFPGESQALELMGSWQGMAALALVATGLVKCLATPLCLHFGWRGGHLFPCMFSGIAAGYGIASMGGADPMLCVAITTATLMSGVQRKPLIALALLLLCFPVSSLPWMGAACLLGAAAPMPAAIVGMRDEA